VSGETIACCVRHRIAAVGYVTRRANFNADNLCFMVCVRFDKLYVCTGVCRL